MDGPKLPKYKNFRKRYSDSTKPSQINKRYKTYNKKKDKERKKPFHKKENVKTKKQKKKNIKYYKCGKLGHYANRCYTKKKI